MDTKKYEVFEKTVELSSLTKAAEELGLTQSGVSHIIAALEEEFGFPLLMRSRTGARLTPEGEKIMPILRDILRSQEQLTRRRRSCAVFRRARCALRRSRVWRCIGCPA